MAKPGPSGARFAELSRCRYIRRCNRLSCRRAILQALRGETYGQVTRQMEPTVVQFIVIGIPIEGLIYASGTQEATYEAIQPNRKRRYTPKELSRSDIPYPALSGWR